MADGVRKSTQDAIRDELEFRLRTVASYYRTRGKRGEAAKPNFIENEIQRGTEKLVRIITEETTHG